MNRFAYARADSVSGALDALSETCRPLAGGTDLLSMIKEDLIAPSQLVDLKRIPGLDQVEVRSDGLHIGPLIPLSRLLDDPAVSGSPEIACLRQALAHTASPQIRHMATIGGNLLQRPRCWYFRNERTHCLRKGGRACFAFRGENKGHAILGGGPCYIVHPSDPAVALLALGASVEITGVEGTRVMPLGDFYLLPSQDPRSEVALGEHELLTKVFVPTPAPGSRGIYLKAAERGVWDFGLASVAVHLDFSAGVVQGARVALGGVAPVPWHAVEAERALIGSALNDATIERTAQAATEGVRPLAKNAYKVDLVQGLVRQALADLT